MTERFHLDSPEQRARAQRRRIVLDYLTTAAFYLFLLAGLSLLAFMFIYLLRGGVL
jgi:hypothetical protein